MCLKIPCNQTCPLGVELLTEGEMLMHHLEEEKIKNHDDSLSSMLCPGNAPFDF